ncbi:MAG TPA: hypothetical protein DGO43_05710 [Chloroflexi bacterium]|nr:hypothetical protein [Chloroflexota bacterium]|tara:strand:- start:3247 stop:5787 length:2541 start_codon:yes stop_codon:yes gene_type:complete
MHETDEDDTTVARRSPNEHVLAWLDTAVDWGFNNNRAWHAAAFLVFVAAALVFTFPLVLVANSHITYKPSGDQLFLLSILEWQRTTIFSNPNDFFAGNFYYGSGNALFGSDLLLGFLPIYGPVALISGNPVLAYSITHIGAYVLNAIAMYVTVLTLTKSRPGAVTAGAIYAFGPLQLAYASHLQLLGAWWLPLVLLFSLHFQRKKSWLSFGLAVLMVWLQFATAVHLGVLAGVIFLAFGVTPALVKILTTRNGWLAIKLIAIGVVVSAPFVPIVQGYLAFSEAWQADRDLTEVQFWSVQLRDYLSPTDRLRWYDVLAERFSVPRGERRVFPGFIPPALALCGVIAGLRTTLSTKKGLKAITAGLVVLVLIAVLFSLGTHWKRHEIVSDIQLPYLFLFDHVPVFRAIRVVARFSLLAHFSFAVLGGIGIAAIAKYRWQQSTAPSIVGIVATLLVLAEAVPEPLSAFSIPTHGKLRGALEQTEPGPMLFVPVTGNEEIQRLWLTTQTGAGPLVNGYSGHIWQQYWYFRDATQGLMESEMSGLAKGLQSYGIRTVVVDLQKLGNRDSSIWETFAASPFTRSVNRIDRYLLITLRDLEVPPANNWTDLKSQVLVDNVQPDTGFVSTLVLDNTTDQAWIPPGNSNVRQISIRWDHESGQKGLVLETDVLPPPFLRPGQVHTAEMHVFTPSLAGNYLLSASIDGQRFFEQQVVVASRSHTSFDGSADGMGANLSLRTPNSFVAKPASLLPLHVDALNSGRVAWVDPANIRLGWRWFEVSASGDEMELPEYEGRSPLLGHIWGDIPPGRGYAFTGQLRTPDKPGNYIVRVSMLIELVAWFTIDPIEIQVTVLE